MGVEKAKGLHGEFFLSERDVSVLRHLVNGEEINEIAGALGKSPATIKFHLRLIRAELRARSLRHLVALAMKYGIISLDDVEP